MRGAGRRGEASAGRNGSLHREGSSATGSEGMGAALSGEMRALDDPPKSAHFVTRA